LTAIGTLENVKKSFDRPVDRSVELGVGFCFQQRCYAGVGSWLKDAGRGLAREARLSSRWSVIAGIGKTKPYH
jgi:hypothetical protein